MPVEELKAHLNTLAQRINQYQVRL